MGICSTCDAHRNYEEGIQFSEDMKNYEQSFRHQKLHNLQNHNLENI